MEISVSIAFFRVDLLEASASLGTHELPGSTSFDFVLLPHHAKFKAAMLPAFQFRVALE